jgi:predicted acyl esterase
MAAAGSSEIRDGMRIDWDVPIQMDDGTVLRADVFRPPDAQPCPVIMTHGPYGKGVAFQEGYPGMWQTLAAKYPDAVAGSSNRYQVWETVDPEKWVVDGYACVRVDSRGAGRSPGYLDIFSPRETRDYYECIEWAGSQPWSNGKVGLLGVSYYGMNQWQVAALRPPHLVAICPWEAASDYYREFTHHGGILNIFTSRWYPVQVSSVQHGVGDRGLRDVISGEPAAGPVTLSDGELAANRSDPVADLLAHPLDDDYYAERSPKLEDIEVPVLSAANWGHHLHTRGNFEAIRRVSSPQRWLEVHGFEHYAEFYTDYGVELQKRFFGHFLKGEDTGWPDQPPVQLNVRRVDGTFERRAETAWPLPTTQWTKLHLDIERAALSGSPAPRAGRSSFDVTGEGLTYLTEPLAEETEITGPAAARLFIASSTADADVFVVLRVLDPAGKDVTFVSGLDPRGTVANGWLRASHRRTDPDRSFPYRPWHPHDDVQPLEPGEVVGLDVEIWPTSVIVPAGYRIGLTVSGRDFEMPGDGPWPAVYGVTMRGNGIFLHTDATDRPAEVFGGTTTLVSGGEHESYVLLPFVPRPGRS